MNNAEVVGKISSFEKDVVIIIEPIFNARREDILNNTHQVRPVHGRFNMLTGGGRKSKSWRVKNHGKVFSNFLPQRNNNYFYSNTLYPGNNG